MKEAEKREIMDSELVKDFLKRAQSKFGPKNVTTYSGEGGIIIQLSNDVSKVTRKQHNFPEHLRKEGD